MSTVVTEMLSHLIRREAEGEEPPPSCPSGNEFDGNIGLRVSALFVILVTSGFGALFPLIAKNSTIVRMPNWVFFFAKYFGSGVIIATAFIHLLTPANEALTNPCLTGVISEYPWAQGIALMAVFALFFVELLAMRYSSFNTITGALGRENSACSPGSSIRGKRTPSHTYAHSQATELQPRRLSLPRNEGPDPESGFFTEVYAAQLTSLFILEFGVIFHSVFIGLTLAVAGAEFKTLYAVLVFHQMFEGLGLGARLASVDWPFSKRWTPWLMAIGYGLSTPIAIAIGLGLKESYAAEGRTTLIVNGVFDALSAGILLYTGLVELMAHEFLFSNTLKNASAITLFGALANMCVGAGLMALLGKWA